LPARRGRPDGRTRGRRLGARQVSQLGRGPRQGYRAGDWACIATGAVAFAIALAAGATTKGGHVIALAVQHFLLFYAGVFALVTLTASVGAGLAAADRVFMSPGGRIAAQAAHRAVSFAAVAFLAVHVTVEVLAGRSRPADAVVPFLHPGRTFYLGIGTVASDLLIVIVVTGLLRGRFASLRPAWLWRAMHAVAYLCWPFAIMHGLLAGRTAKPYVDWSYGACVAAVALALVFRVAAGPRLGETAAGPAEEAPAMIPSLAVPPGAQLAGAGLTAAGLAGPAGPGSGLPGPGLSRPGSPFAPGSPSYAPGSQSPFVPGEAGAWGRRALPAPSNASGLTRGHPSFPGLGGVEPASLRPAHSGPGYPDAGHPYQGWAGHDEPAQAPSRGDGGR
jgi:DMSO/TMAO reductase YedYZ heme-binding membrane subunit